LGGANVAAPPHLKCGRGGRASLYYFGYCTTRKS